MLSSYEEQIHKPAIVHGLTGWRPGTLRAWKRRGLTAPLEIFATGEHTLYSFLEITLFQIAKHLIDNKVETSEAFRIAGSFAPQVQGMLLRSGEWKSWVVLWRSETGAIRPPFATTDPQNLLQLVSGDAPVAMVVNLGSIARTVREKIRASVEHVE